MPLSGLRVVDLTRILAGPFCSMILGDMGAEVIKVETPGEGDPVRRQGVVRDGLSWYFAGFNRNKRSLTLNLRDAEGRAVLARLIAGSDVLVENFRPGVPDGAPMRAGPPIADLVAGVYAALGVCAALVRRSHTGRGETVGAGLNN